MNLKGVISILIEQYDIVKIKDQGRKHGSVQSGPRPGVVLQNNKGNHFSTTTIIAYITSKEKNKLPVHVILDGYNLNKNCTVLLEQIMTIPKSDIESKIDRLRYEDRIKVDKALRISLGQV